MREREERDRRTPSSRRNKRACFGDIYIEEVEGIILAMSKTNRFQGLRSDRQTPDSGTSADVRQMDAHTSCCSGMQGRRDLLRPARERMQDVAHRLGCS